jgi:hypothetical protein
MSKYIKTERVLKPNEVLVGTQDSARRKAGDFIKVAYIARNFSDIDYMVGYDFQRRDFSECRHARLVNETRPATKEEITLFKMGKTNINE